MSLTVQQTRQRVQGVFALFRNTPQRIRTSFGNGDELLKLNEKLEAGNISTEELNRINEIIHDNLTLPPESMHDGGKYGSEWGNISGNG